jgi:hypothetical protein
MELAFDPLLSRFEPRSFFFQASRCSAALCRSNQISCAVGMTKGSRATVGRAGSAANGTKPKFFNDFSARVHARARNGRSIRTPVCAAEKTYT